MPKEFSQYCAVEAKAYKRPLEDVLEVQQDYVFARAGFDRLLRRMNADKDLVAEGLKLLTTLGKFGEILSEIAELWGHRGGAGLPKILSKLVAEIAEIVREDIIAKRLEEIDKEEILSTCNRLVQLVTRRERRIERARDSFDAIWECSEQFVPKAVEIQIEVTTGAENFLPNGHGVITDHQYRFSGCVPLSEVEAPLPDIRSRVDWVLTHSRCERRFEGEAEIAFGMDHWKYQLLLPENRILRTTIGVSGDPPKAFVRVNWCRFDPTVIVDAHIILRDVSKLQASLDGEGILREGGTIMPFHLQMHPGEKASRYMQLALKSQFCKFTPTWSRKSRRWTFDVCAKNPGMKAPVHGSIGFSATFIPHG